MQRSDIYDAISPLAEAISAYWRGLLDLSGIEESTVALRLSVTDATCPECVMPRDTVEELLLDAIVSAGHPVDRVRLEDPRVGTTHEGSDDD